MTVQVAGITDTGRKRAHNEDSLLVDSELGLYIVADGMGGYDKGEVASCHAALSLHAHIQDSGALLDVDSCVEALKEGVQVAAERIRSISGPSSEAMGTTLTALWLVRGKAIMAHVGDSRLYRLRGGRLAQLSRDHTLVQMLIDKNRCSPSRAKAHPMGHVLVRAIKSNTSVKADIEVFDTEPGDTFLLCSDGLTSYVQAPEIEAVLKGADLQQLSTTLVDKANRRGGGDNITLIAARLDADANGPSQPPTLLLPSLPECDRVGAVNPVSIA